MFLIMSDLAIWSGDLALHLPILYTPITCHLVSPIHGVVKSHHPLNTLSCFKLCTCGCFGVQPPANRACVDQMGLTSKAFHPMIRMSPDTCL